MRITQLHEMLKLGKKAAKDNDIREKKRNFAH